MLDRLLAGAERRRRRRYEQIIALIGLAPHDRILDVGCGSGRALECFNSENLIVGLDLQPQAHYAAPNFHYLQGSALALPFSDHSFDVVYSNSVIEHIPEPRDQARMAAEIRRVGRRYYLQTPNRAFPIEPHFLFPGFQFLPERAKRWLADRWTPAAMLGWYPRHYERIRLLTRADLAALFPDAIIHEEHAGPLVKSFMVVGGQSTPHAEIPAHS